MRRVRRAGPAALVLVLLATLGSPGSRPVLAGPVPWSTATLVLSELQTGGASASDEFVEIANQGAGPVDLVGLELVYATSSGSTVTRKASWPASTILAAGQRTLVANGAGLLAGVADQVYSGGFAATGGTLALRIIGGEVIDAVGWGDATNAFVEGVAAPAPAAGTSLERLPGGPDGNGEDTNDNATDWFLQASPGPQGLSAPLVPGPGGPVPTPVPTPTMTPSPTSTVSPTASPSPAPTPTPSASPTGPPTPAPTPTASPSPTPSPTPTASPSASPTPSPSPTPTATPTATAIPTPTASPTPSPTPDTTQAIAAARAAADGSIVTVVATLTTDLGALESGHTAFVQDATAGIAIYLTTPATATIPAGTRVRVTGEVSSRYAQRTIRVDEPDAIVTLDAPGLPAAHGLATGLADEASEGLRIATSGTLLAGRDELADGTAVSIDDGSGPVRLVIAPGALAGIDLTTGSQVAASGPLGQRDSTGSGTTGYRLYVTRADDLIVTPPPTPSPTLPPTPSPSTAPSPTPTANPTGTATPAPTVAPTATPAPTSSLSVDPIVDARQQTVGASVTVRGTVTAEPGRLGTPPLIAIQDATGGIVVRLPDDAARPARGDVLVVTGALADPYGQLEVRPKGVTGVLRVDRVTGPAATQVTTLGESTEGRLVTIVGTIATKPAKASSGDLTFDLEVAGGRRLRLAADASSRIAATSLTTGWTVRVTGIGGQRASRKGALDGYRVWLRDPADIVRTAGPSAAPTSSPSPTTGHTATPAPSATGVSSTPIRSIAAAIRTTDEVRIRAVVTAGRTLLDASGRRIVVQDASGAVEILLPADIAAPGPGARVEVAGRMGTAYGAPRLRATDLERLGSDAVPAPLEVRGALTKAHTWRLVRIHGRIEDTRKLGDRVRAEIVVGAQRIVVVGQPSVGLTSDDLPEGTTVTITGVVRAAYPNATDQRPSLLPRSKRDVQVQGRGAVQGASGSATGGDGGGAAAAGADAAASNGDGGPGDATSGAGVPDADLVALAAVEGQMVRVGGLVVDLTTDGFTLDDGTAIGVVVLAGSAVDLAPLIEPTDAINVIGRVERRPADEPDADDGFVVVVDDPAGVTLGADLGSGASTLTDPAPSSQPSPVADPAIVRVAGLGDPLAGLPGAGAGLTSLLLVAVASVVVTWLRRRHARTLLDHRVAVRLAGLARSGAPEAVVRGPDGPGSPGSPAGPKVA